VKTRRTEIAVAVAAITTTTTQQKQQQKEKCKNNKHLVLNSKKFLSKNLKAGFHSFRLFFPSVEIRP
jgi:hypothetical protein